MALPAQQTAETKTDAEHLPAAMAPPGEERVTHGVADHAGIYPLYRQLVSSAGGKEPPGDRIASLLADPEYSHPVNDAARARVVGDLQRDFGNAYVQRLAARVPRIDRALVLRQSHGGPGPDVALRSTPGQPLDSETQAQMSSRFGHDFSSVRLHNDGSAQQAAESLNATAFTAGRDVYFNRGAYDPGSSQGQALLAHELAHVVQHDTGATAGATGVSEPRDPLEREADAISQEALAGRRVSAAGAGSTPSIQRQAQVAAPPGAPAGGGAPGTPPATPRTGDFVLSFAGLSFPVPLPDVVRQAREGKVSVPPSLLRKLPSKPLKITELTLDLDENKSPLGGTISAEANIPPIEGSGTLNLDKDGNATGTVKAAFRSNKIPGLNDVEATATVSKDKFLLETDVGFGYKNVIGSLHYKYDGHHSGKGKAHYEGSKLKGDIEVILSEEGKASGSGKLEAELFKGLRGSADVAISQKGDIKVVGKLVFGQQIELFPEKKYEKSFFNFEKKFPLWGFTIPVIDVNVGLFAEIHASAGFRAKFGPGVLRDIQVTGEFGTDPEAVTQFGVGGEFFLPAGAEVVLVVGGGIGLGLAIADITGGIEAQGVAGLYSALSVRPQFKYSNGKYTISGAAEIAGIAQIKLGINAFAKVDVGVWMFKGTVWRKDWTLAEWIWNTGLNVALRANVSYTLGEDFAPDFSFETGQVDPEKLVRDVMPDSGSPVPAPPKPPVPDKATFTAEGAAGGPTGAAPAAAPAPPTPGTPAAKTTPGQGPVAAPGAPASTTSATPKLPPPPAAMSKDPEDRTDPETWQVIEYTVLAANQASPATPVLRARSTESREAEYLNLDEAYAKLQKLHPGSTITRAEFDDLNKNKYFDPTVSGTNVRAKFRNRKYTIDGDYKIPRDPDTGTVKPLIVPSVKAGSSFKAITASGAQNSMSAILERYNARAKAGLLRTFPREPRPDMPALWDGYLKSGIVKTARDRTTRMDEVDHIVELQVGGQASAPENLQLLNESDNGSSGATIAGQARKDMKEVKSEKVKYTKAEEG